jgi:hypothetical protein
MQTKARTTKRFGISDWLGRRRLLYNGSDGCDYVRRVFGSGTRVVWIPDCSKHDEGAEGALIHEVLTGLIAVQQG